MILWFIVGFIVWALCILFMLAIFKVGNPIRRHEQKLHCRNMVNTGKGEGQKKVEKGTELVFYIAK